MAAFNFPNSPSTNDLHTENGVTFKWNGTMWLRVGPAYTDTTNLNVTGIGTFDGNVAIGGTLTYEDVKNVDSVGVITARSNLYVGSAITCYASTGIVSATAFHGDAANLTNLPASAPVGTGTDRAFFLNDKVILSSYDIPAEKNAGTFGPVQVAAAKTVTVPSGSVWTIV